MSSLHISFSAEPVFHVGSLAITNSILTSIIVSVLLILFALIVRKQLSFSGKPGRLQSFVEMIIEALNNLVVETAGKGKKSKMFAPIIITFFLFILVNNWFGLLPGVGTVGFMEKKESTVIEEVQQVQAAELTQDEPAQASPTTQEEHATTTEEVVQETTTHEEEKTEEHAGEEVFVPYLRAGTADLNTTIALALISMVLVQFMGFRFLGFSYLKKFFDFSNPIAFFVGILELVSDISKIISFAFRLFGNIFAGEVLLAVISSLIPVVLPMPFYGLELFVGLVQALVFAMLSLVFFNMATLGHGGEEH